MLRTLFILLAYGSGSLLAFRTVNFAAVLYIWSNIFRPLEWSRHAGLFPAPTYVAGLLVVSHLYHYFRGRYKPLFGLFTLMVLAQVAWLILVTMVSPFRPVLIPDLIVLLKYLLPVILIHAGIKTLADAKLVALGMLSAMAIWIAHYGLYCIAKGSCIDIGIEGGLMAERNDFTAAVVSTIPVLFYFGVHYHLAFKRLGKWAFRGLGSLAVGIIFLSLSRGASLALGFQGLLYAFVFSPKRIRDVSILMACVAAGFFFVPEKWVERMSTISLSTENQKEASASHRLIHIQGTLEAIKDFPVFGVGPEGWQQITYIYGRGFQDNPHNIYLMVAISSGLPGLALYLSIMLISCYRVFNVRRRALKIGDGETAALAAALLSSIAGYLAALTFLNRPFGEFLFSWLAIGNALPRAFDYKQRMILKNAKARKPAAALP
ncbi:MAG TPA: O-antigen ligase family protein [Fibrobacteria bacterium]|nr:O-antigen ligase family protein [Fibrobacteria bacterium]